MRNAFAHEMVTQARMRKQLVLLSGDIGNRLFDPFKAEFPDRFFNCGVAEANMTSMAAGMAMSGLLPVTYTITPFNTSRCYEQIKVDVCYHDLPVVIVGVGSGLSYAGLGPTHHSFEDIAIMRALPNMHVVCPCDPVETCLALSRALDLKRPVYLRLGKKNEPVIFRPDTDFEIGKGIILREGKDLCILSCGTVLPMALQAADALCKRGIEVRLIDMHTVKPLDSTLLEQVFQKYERICTVEEHSVMGGFGSAIAEWAADRRMLNKTLLRFGIGDGFLHSTGNMENARKMTGLTPENLVSTLVKTL